MSSFKSGFCLCWFSGFFAFPALIHALRYLMGWPMIVGSMEFTMMCSLGVFAVAGLISFACVYYCGCCGSCGSGSK